MVTLSELHSLDDLRNDPDEYARFLMERRKKDKEEEDRDRLLTLSDERRKEEEQKLQIAKKNSEENAWGWAGLPSIVLSHIMDHLPLRDRHRASSVCKTWYWTFHTPNIWRELVLEETSFVRTSSIVIRSDSGFGSCIKRTVKTGPHKGWLNSIGDYVKSIRLTSMDDYGIMSGHCAILTKLLKICREELGYYPLPRLKRFSFTFNPAFLEGETMSLYLGTGGNIMHSINSLVNSFRGLEDVCINDLLLETMEETTDLILGLTDCCGTTMKRLELLNLTRDPLSICCFVFTRLHTLVVSPPQITTEMVQNFGESVSLRKVHIVQDKFSSTGPAIEAETWDDVREKNPSLRVRLQINANLKEDVIIQPHAPVSEIIYNSKYTKISSSTICEIVDNYSKTLTLYAHTSLPRFYGSKSFHERCDSSLLLLVRNCSRLNKLVIRERVSTATLLLIASRHKHVKKLVVRRNCIVKRCEWPKNVSWTDVWYDWLKYSSRCYDRTLEDIRDLKRQPGWNWLSDFEFSIFDLSTIADENCGLSPANAFIDVDGAQVRFRQDGDNVESSLDYCND